MKRFKRLAIEADLRKIFSLDVNTPLTKVLPKKVSKIPAAPKSVTSTLEIPSNLQQITVTMEFEVSVGQTKPFFACTIESDTSLLTTIPLGEEVQIKRYICLA